MPRGAPALPSAGRTRRDRATVPRPPTQQLANSSPRVCARRNKWHQRQTQRAGSANRCPLGDGLLHPRDRGGPRTGGVSNHFGGVWLWGCFSCPLFLGFSLHIRHFISGIEHYFPPGIHILDQILYACRVPNSVGPGQWFKPHFLFLFFVLFARHFSMKIRKPIR